MDSGGARRGECLCLLLSLGAGWCNANRDKLEKRPDGLILELYKLGRQPITTRQNACRGGVAGRNKASRSQRRKGEEEKRNQRGIKMKRRSASLDVPKVEILG